MYYVTRKTGHVTTIQLITLKCKETKMTLKLYQVLTNSKVNMYVHM